MVVPSRFWCLHSTGTVETILKQVTLTNPCFPFQEIFFWLKAVAHGVKQTSKLNQLVLGCQVVKIPFTSLRFQFHFLIMYFYKGFINKYFNYVLHSLLSSDIALST